MSDSFKVVSAIPERAFVKVYKDFLRSKLLTTEEKMVYIALKSFVSYGEDSDTVWPTMTTLSEITAMSEPRTRRAINNLVKKGVIKKKRQGLSKPNVYTLWDSSYLWAAETKEELEERSKATEEEIMAERLRAAGYIVYKKEEEPGSVTDQSTDTSPKPFVENIFSEEESTKKSAGCQLAERYSMEDIKRQFGYEAVTAAVDKDDADAVFNILYDFLNTTKKTIRVGGEDRPAEVVRSRLMDLEYSDLEYVVRKYHEQTGRISNPKAYVLTQLYNARGQNRLDMMNEGHVNGDF